MKFYRDYKGKSEIVEYLDELKECGETSKNERINRDKILAYIGALEKYGTRVGQPVVKHIDGSLWELRPLANRIFFFYSWRGFNTPPFRALLSSIKPETNTS